MHKSAVILDIVEAGKMGTIGISHHYLLSDDGDQGWAERYKGIKGSCEGPQQEGSRAQEKAMRDKERKAELLSRWTWRPDGKRTENDVLAFYGEMERDFPQLLNRRNGDPYQNLHSDLKGYIEETEKTVVKTK